jgi:hypothetical protein
MQAKKYSLKYSFTFFFAYQLLTILLNVIFFSPTISKLEDEFAYYYQSLIFEKGILFQNVIKPDNISWERLGEIIQLPYIFFTNGITYSSHHHGWSFFLTGFSYFGLREYSNFFIFLISFLVYYNLCMEIFPKGYSTGKTISILLFIASPLLNSLSHSYMSHLSSLLFLMLMVLFRIRAQKINNFLSLKFAIITLLLGMSIFFAFWIRLQSAIPTILAILVYDIILFIKNYKSNKKMIFLSLSTLGFVILSYVSMKYYYNLFPSKVLFLTSAFFNKFFPANCQNVSLLNFESMGCFPTYNTVGHSFRKMILNVISLVSSLNAEHSPFNLPLLAFFMLLLPIGFKRIKKCKFDLLLLLIFIFNLGIFSFYWHDGGDNYRGRYLSDTIFSFYILIGLWGTLFLNTFFSKIYIKYNFKFGVFIFCFLSSLFPNNLSIKGDFINSNSFNNSFDKTSSNAPKNSVIIAADDMYLDVIKESALENKLDNKILFSRKQILSFLNIGNSSIASNGIRIDSNGYLRDKSDNLLLTEIRKDEIDSFKNLENINDCYKITFKEYLPMSKKNKNFNIWEKKDEKIERCF